MHRWEIVGDLVLIAGSALAANLVQELAAASLAQSTFAVPDPRVGTGDFVGQILLLSLCWILCSDLCGFYRSRRTRSSLATCWSVLESLVVSMGVALVLTHVLLGPPAVSVAMALPTALVVVSAVKLVATSGLRQLRSRGLNFPRFSVLKHGTKRFLDVALACFLIIFLIMPLVAIALAIKLHDLGPIFHRQVRVGLNGSLFTILKFRTMHVGAEPMLAQIRHLDEEEGPAFKTQIDPRVTRVGRLLRKHSLDELPQLFNVLRGDMSLVGPRPPTPEEVSRYDW